MKIAISLLSGISYGSVTYFRNLLPALAEIDKENEYYIFIDKNNELKREINQSNFIFNQCSFNTSSTIQRHFWEQIVLPLEIKKRKIEILFTAKNANILLAPCKTIISIRNMEPLCYKRYKNHWKLNLFSFLRSNLTKLSIKKSSRVIAVSKFVSEFLKNNFPDAIDKIDIIYNGNPITNHNNKNPLTYQTEKFLLTASKFVTYANQLNLIAGYLLLCKKNNNIPALWIAGGIHDKLYFNKIKKMIEENDFNKKIKILGLVSHENLMQLYQNAIGFLFPSTLEACPQTLIEAMTYELPIATSNMPPMTEICKDAAIYFDPFDKNDIAEKIQVILEDESLKSRLKNAALERSKFFDWKKTAKEITDVFQKVHRNSF